MAHQAETAIRALRDSADARFPGSIVEYPLFDLTPTQWGFGVAYGNGLTLISANVTDIPADQWSVKMSSGLAAHIPDVAGPLLWANQRNRDTAYGKYYCAIDQANGRSVVIYENYLPALLFSMLFDGPHGPGTFSSVAGWIKGMLFSNISTADEEEPKVVQAFGGERFPPTEDGLGLLFVASSG